MSKLVETSLPQKSKNFIYVNIKKPIYGNYVGVRETYIWKAKREHKLLRITTPKGTTTISPNKYLEGADRIEKVFLIPDKPMVLYFKNLVPDKPKEEKPPVRYIQDLSIPFEVLERLRDRAKQLDLIK